MPLGDGYECGCSATATSASCPHKSGSSNISPAEIHPDENQKDAPSVTEKVRPTQVWFVQGKKANKNFRSAFAVHRENATLQETEQEDDSQREFNKKT